MLTNTLKDAAVAAAQATMDAITAWPADVPERADELNNAKFVLLGVQAAVVPPAFVRVPDSDLVLSEKEQLFADRKAVAGMVGGTGAVGGWQDQNIYNLATQPGMYVQASNAPIRMENIGGDWFDATGAKQGLVPYATVKFTDLGSAVPGWFESSDLSELTQQFADGTVPNWGYGFKGGDNATIICDSLYTTTPDNRPHLVVTTAYGDVTCYPERMVSVYGGNLTTQAENPAFQFAPTWFTMAYVDLSQFKGQTITAAKWRFHSTNQFGNSTGLILRVRNHAYDAPLPPVEYGLAKDYPLDVGIENDPRVLAVIRPEPTMAFDKTSWMGWHPNQKYGKGNNSSQIEVITDPAQMFMGTVPVMRVTFYAGGPQSALERHSPLWRGYNGLHQLSAPPKRISWRYVARFNNGQFGEPAWRPAPLGGKLPGVNGRFRGLTASFIDASGFPPVLVPTLPGAGLGNSGSTQSGMNGPGSARMNFDPADPNSPLKDCAGFGHGDCYDAMIVGPYGHNWMADKGLGGHARLGEFVCIEGEAWVNTVTHPDAKPVRLSSIVNNGNGTATATLWSPITDTRWYTQDALWSIGGSLQVTEAATSGNTKGFNRAGVPITPLDSTHFTYPLQAGVKTASAAIPANDGSEQVWLMAVAGQGNFDGGLRTRLNGRIILEQTGIVFHHSEFLPDGVTPIGWDTVWWCVFYGGGTYPVVDASMDMTLMAVATDYLGPVVLTP